MDHGTFMDYILVFAYGAKCGAGQADRVIGWLQAMDGDSPFQITRLEHCLQTATRAEQDGADEETVVCALLHDLGEVLGPYNHSQFAAALLRPYVSEKNYWIVKHHGLFQGYYYLEHFGKDKNARDRYKDHPYYQDCVDFCANWDQCSFDPGYQWKPLEYFIPMVKQLFARKPNPFA